MHPPSRHALFPHAPLAAINAATGNLQVPRAGTLGSPDSLSGAPEAHAGETVEHEAAHFVAGLGALGAGALAGPGGAPKHKLADKLGELEAEGDTNGSAVPDPVDMVLQAKSTKDAAYTDGQPSAGEAVVKTSMEDTIWEKARQLMHALADAADTWERFAK